MKPSATPPVTIATHNGPFHADDVVGCAILKRLYPDSTIIRTREPARIEAATFAVDVGGQWDDECGRYDHHQKGFTGARASGPTYASAGLVWLSFGAQYIRSFDADLNDKQVSAIKTEVDLDLMQYLDMEDTGAGHAAQGCFGLAALLAELVPNWLDEVDKSRAEREDLKNESFLYAMSIAGVFISSLVRNKIAQQKAMDFVRSAPRMYEGRVLYLLDGGMPWTKVVCAEMPDVLFVVYSESSDNHHHIRTVPVAKGSFQARLDLPQAWAGLRDVDLAAVTGVPDAVFCHTGRFIAGAVGLDGAMEMVRQALAGSN